MNKFNTSYPAVPEFAEQPFSYPAIEFPQFPFKTVYPVACTPDTNATHEIMRIAAGYWTAMNHTAMLFPFYFATETAMEEFYLNLSTQVKGGAAGAGIVFEDGDLASLRYTLRFPSELMPATSKPYIRDNGND